MESDSSHRELPPDPRQQPEAAPDGAPPSAMSDRPSASSAPQASKAVMPGLSWADLSQPLEKSEAGRPGSISKYKKAKASSEPSQKFGKGCVVDEAG